MIDLDRNGRSRFMQSLYQLVKARHETVVIDPDLARSVRADRIFHIRVFENDKSGSAFGAQRVVIHVPAAHFAARFAVIRSHRRHRDAVLDRCPFDGKRFKNLRIFFVHLLLLFAKRSIRFVTSSS